MCAVGEEVMENIKLTDFARREILALRQNLITKVMEYEKDLVYKKYEHRIGELVSGEVSQVWRKEILVIDEDGVELVLPKAEQIPADKYKKGDTLTAVVLRVEVRASSLLIIISRTAPTFLERLMETEIPEINDGLITIKNVVRAPGERAKVLVESYDDRIDPVGACVGMKGSRIHSIVRELRNENIDVINYTSNVELLISRALSPAKITSIEINEENKTANVYMKSEAMIPVMTIAGTNSHGSRAHRNPTCRKARTDSFKIFTDIGLCLDGKRQHHKRKHHSKSILIIHLYSVFYILINLKFLRAQRYEKKTIERQAFKSIFFNCRVKQFAN